MGRLFWKIFLWFWLAIALLNFAVGWGVKIYLEQSPSSDRESLQAQVAAIGLAFEHGDTPRARRLLWEISRQVRHPIYVISPKGEDILQRPLPPAVRRFIGNGNFVHRHVLSKEVELPTGEKYMVLAPQRPWVRGQIAAPPIWLGLAITLVISTLVCYWLAKYLSTPIRRLSSATHKLAEGRLDVRVGDMNRRDELADLALDFDQMAIKIQQLLNAQRQLLQDISHELRSPLARLQVALALAQRSEGGEKKFDFRLIGKDLDRLEMLIDEVLTLSRLDSVPYELEDLDMGELVLSIVEDCTMEAGEKGCQIDCQMNDSPLLRGSQELLRRAVENILRNAIHYANSGSSITCNLSATATDLEINICNKGPTIAEASLKAMFEPFVRLDGARGHQNGYGLGLAIAKKSIERHGGGVEAKNLAASGVCITIKLPLIATAETT